MMSERCFQVVLNPKLNRIELREGGEPFMGAPAPADVKEFLTRAFGRGDGWDTALVEEIQAKVYDTAKSRMLTFVEMLIGLDSKIDGQAAARLLSYLTQDIEDVIWQVAEKHGVDVSRPAVEKARGERQRRENIERVKFVGQRIADLRRELEALERQKDRIERGNLVWEIGNLIEEAKTETLHEVVNAFKLTREQRTV